MNTTKFISYLTLINGLSISAIAIYYSVCGLISIFSGSMIPILIMGTGLEISKLVATVWLKQCWEITPPIARFYLIIAIIILMLITSLGIFGFLSKAHLEQGVSSGYLSDKISLIDGKIKIRDDEINSAQKSLEQLNSAVDQTMLRSTSEKGANRSIKVRKSQQSERDFLQKRIQVAQTEKSKLFEEKLPLEQQLRKEKVEFGPILYISALIYEDGQKNLENAVRYVIILLVIVFDPLAVVLLLCSQYGFIYLREEELKTQKSKDTIDVINPPIPKNISINNIKSNDLPEMDIDEDDILDEEIPEGDFEKLKQRAAKMKWKAENKNDTIKRQERLYRLGLIDKLPWSE